MPAQDFRAAAQPMFVESLLSADAPQNLRFDAVIA
jgi:hypothetical protein